MRVSRRSPLKTQVQRTTLTIHCTAVLLQDLGKYRGKPQRYDPFIALRERSGNSWGGVGHGMYMDMYSPVSGVYGCMAARR